ncbi:uncharacterized protein VTP21DRAFT_6891 [Calcarisporiella thermophila]|uniref:uncharacterized protein n=1 Tax=Calcarisporiella thermophila TaxID=911321 RepID=UPI00374255A3
MFKNYSLVLLPFALLGLFCPSLASPSADVDSIVDKRCGGYNWGSPCEYCDYDVYGGYPCGGYGNYGGYCGYGYYPSIYNNAYYANAANVDNCFKHRANLAANVKASECTDASNHANVYNTANTNTIVKRSHRYSCCAPYGIFDRIGYGCLPYGFGGFGFGLPYGCRNWYW